MHLIALAGDALQERGFGAMLIAFVGVLVWDCVKGARTRQRDATIPAIAASVSVLVGVHALVDFSLQIRAVTLTYMAVLGAGVAQAREEPTSGTLIRPRRTEGVSVTTSTVREPGRTGRSERSEPREAGPRSRR